VAAPGARVAVNLAGIDHHDVHRGAAVVHPGQWVTPAAVDVRVELLPGHDDLPRRALHAHVGAGEQPVRLQVLDRDRALARLHLQVPVPLAPDDRIVLRSTGARATVAGAVVLDVEPASRTAAARARLGRPLVERLLDARPWTNGADLVPLAGLDPVSLADLLDGAVAAGVATRVGSWIVSSDVLQRTRASARELVARHHDTHPSEPGVELAALAGTLGLDATRVRAALADDPELVVDREVVRLASHAADASSDPDARRLLAALRATPFAPPEPTALGVDPAVVRSLARSGDVVELDGVVFAASALDAARDLVIGALRDRGALAVADVRDLLGSTRKFVLPIVNQLDREGVTRRRGAERVAGPRALRASAEQ
jgi:selenocysteine-specific elongation factor